MFDRKGDVLDGVDGALALYSIEPRSLSGA
jgi:hypothetical protein